MFLTLNSLPRLTKGMIVMLAQTLLYSLPAYNIANLSHTSVTTQSLSAAPIVKVMSLPAPIKPLDKLDMVKNHTRNPL